MTITAALGAMAFVLVRRRAIRGPAWPTEPFLHIDGETVARIRRRRSTVLVIDHRREAQTGAAARLELWRPLEPGEGGVRSLLVLLDAHEAMAER